MSGISEAEALAETQRRYVTIKVPVIASVDGAPYKKNQILLARDMAAEYAADAVEQFLRAQTPSGE